jgi:preprotein translocase subunit SecA
VEGHNFDIRKHLLEYDDVMNKQREVIYQQRREALDSKDIKPIIEDILTEEIDSIAVEFVEQKVLSADWDWQGINERLQGIIGVVPEWDEADKQDLDHDRFVDKLLQTTQRAYEEQEEKIGIEGMRYLERSSFCRWLIPIGKNIS